MIRRRPADPVLRWDSAGPNQEYRVIVRNQDTGEREAIYNGFRTECRLPPHLRLVPDQLAFQVMHRPGDDPEARFVRFRESAPIARLGDDYETPADDLLTATPVTGVHEYRLLVQREDSDRPLVSLVRNEPRFLLPPGQLRDGSFTYHVMVRVRGRWRGRKGLPITKAMIAAADARAARLVPAPAMIEAEILGDPARHAPGRLDRLAPEPHRDGSRLLVAIAVTASPELSPVADPADVARRQWWAGDGSAAVERVALALEGAGLKGVFFVDALASEALGDPPVAGIGRTLVARGHGLGLMVNPEPWRGVSPALAEMDDAAAVEYAAQRFQSLMNVPAQAVSFAPGALSLETLEAVRRAAIPAVLADRASQLSLPAWMRWRCAPFAAYDDLVVIPEGTILSTPAHDRDRVVRHPLGSGDPLAAAHADAIAMALVQTGSDRLVVARIDPLDLLMRSLVRSSRQADAWNRALAETQPAWVEAGWERSPHGFPVLDGQNEIKVEMMLGLVAALGRSGIACAQPKVVFSPGALRTWAEGPTAYDPVVEHRRGPRRLRQSAVRRYDPALLQALKAEPA